MSLKIAETKKAGQDADEIIQEMQLVSHQLAELEEAQNKTELEYSKLILTLPNIFDQTVPIGEDSSVNKEVKKWGNIPKFDFQVSDHIDITQKLNLVDLQRAAKTAGARFYYLRGDLVKLNSNNELEKVTSQFEERSSRADIIPAKTCFCAQDSVGDSCC